MAQDFRQGDDSNNNQKHSGNRNDIVRENKSLLWRILHLRTWRARWRSWRGWFERRDLQFCRRDSLNCGKRYGQRRNGVSRSSGSDRDGIETRGDFWNGPAAPGIAAERVTRDIEKRLGKGIGGDRVSLASRLQCGYVLRERFDQSHAERPHVCGRHERRRRDFRSVVNIESARRFARLADGEESVGGTL